ncbi:hypothetical protein BaRGS_00038805 [Batillaria attramentaria]|uniref:SGNH hydrolase-type esterase domain-containing protein n=1 Tax=Batillaria attramentaria TaxID=370345 RepID=A0ABD0J4P4_9CAEN
MTTALQHPLHSPTAWVPVLQEKKDFRQATFVVPTFLLPTARKVLAARYRHQLASLPNFLVEWEDWNTTRVKFTIDNEDDNLNNYSPTLPHPDLFQNTCRVWIDGVKVVTLTTYYTTGTILAQGTECIYWRRDECKKLTELMVTIYNYFSGPPRIESNRDFCPDVELLALPDRETDITNKEAITQQVKPLGIESVLDSENEDQMYEGDDTDSESLTPPATQVAPPSPSDLPPGQTAALLSGAPDRTPGNNPVCPDPEGMSRSGESPDHPSDDGPSDVTGDSVPSLESACLSVSCAGNNTRDTRSDESGGDSPAERGAAPDAQCSQPSLPESDNDLTVTANSPDQDTATSQATCVAGPSTSLVSTQVTSPDTQATHDAAGDIQQKEQVSADLNAVPVLTDFKLQTVLTDMVAMRQELAAATATISALQLELKSVKTELSAVKQQCATLTKTQTNTDSEIRDSEVRSKNAVRAVNDSLTDAVKQLTKEHSTLSEKQATLEERVTKLTDSKESQGATIRDIKRKLDSLPTALPKSSGHSTNTSPSVTSPTQRPSPVSHEADSPPPIIENTGDLSATLEVENPHAPDHGSSDLSPFATPNPFAALNADTNRAKTPGPQNTAPTTPYDKLYAQDLRADTNTLLLGDSVLRRVDEKKMSVSGAVVQSLWASGLQVSHLEQWLGKRSPVSTVTHVTTHVGINSCKDGPVTEYTWTNLLGLLTKAFPRATLQASSIIPPKGRHHLSKAAYTSNRNLKAACEKQRVIYVDNDPVFLTDNGAPRQSLYHDKLHPSADGARSLALNIRFGGQRRRALRPSLSEVNVSERGQNRRLHPHARPPSNSPPHSDNYRLNPQQQGYHHPSQHQESHPSLQQHRNIATRHASPVPGTNHAMHQPLNRPIDANLATYRDYAQDYGGKQSGAPSGVPDMQSEQHFPSLMSQHPAVSKTVPTPAGILSPASNQPVWGQSVNTSASQDPRQALCMMAQILKQFL